MTSGRTPLRTAVVAATLALAACSGGDPGTAPPEVPAPRPSLAEAGTELSEPPDGTRWVGAGRLVVAVPADWPTEVGPCGVPEDGVVHVATDARATRCAAPLGAGTGVVVTDWSTGSLQPVRGRTVDVGGVEVRRSFGCADSAGAGCSAEAGSAAAGAVVRASAPGLGLPRRIVDTLTLLPDGWVTVPPIELGTPVARAERTLERSGLAARLPQVDWPHYATSTVPPAGTPVPVGSTVEVLPGDG